MSSKRVDGWWWDGTQYRRVDPHDEEMQLDTVAKLAALAGYALVPDTSRSIEQRKLESAIGTLNAAITDANSVRRQLLTLLDGSDEQQELQALRLRRRAAKEQV